MKKPNATPTEILDKDGNLTKIEFYKDDGEHITDALWDPNDDQTPENRKAFREWAYRFINRKDEYEVKV